MGGQDQMFNILAGRALQKELGQEPQVAFCSCRLLVGLDGVKKMSKSLGNYVGISAKAPSEMFGKLMSISDELMPTYYELCTDVPLSDAVRNADRQRLKYTRARRKSGWRGKLSRSTMTTDAAQAADDEFEACPPKSIRFPDDMPEIAVPSRHL